MSVDSWQIIGVVAGCLTTFMTLAWGRERYHRARRQPDRVESLFNGYESLIKQQQVDNDRKGRLIGELETIVDNLHLELDKSKAMIRVLRRELDESQNQVSNLQVQLQDLKVSVRREQA